MIKKHMTCSKMEFEEMNLIKNFNLSAGKSALKLGLPEEAEEHLQEALALDPEYIEALITLASLYNERERMRKLLDLLSYSKEEVEGHSSIKCTFGLCL